MSDGAGGAIITWEDGRRHDAPLDSDIYAQRIDASGMVHWTADGELISGGAVQISAAGQLLVEPEGAVLANGVGGKAGSAASSIGGGGGVRVGVVLGVGLDGRTGEQVVTASTTIIATMSNAVRKMAVVGVPKRPSAARGRGMSSSRAMASG